MVVAGSRFQDYSGPRKQLVPGRETRDRDLLGMPFRESGYLFSGLWKGRGKGRGEGGEAERADKER